MTTSIETLFLKVDSSEVNRAKDALGNFAKAGKDAEAQTNKLSASSLIAQSSLGRYAVAFANPTTAALAFGAAMVAVGVKAVQAAEEARLSIVKLDLIYRNSGKNIGLTLKELEANIQSLAASSKFDDEDIRAGAIEFVKFGNIANNVLKSIMQTSVQYAAFTGTNVVQAASAMARAMADPEAASRLLKNAGVALTNTEQKYISTLMESGRMMEAQAIIARKLADTYKDSEDALKGLGSTYADVFTEIGEAFEALGKTAPIQFISDAGLGALKMARNLVMDITAALGGEDTKNRFFGRLHPATKGIQDSIDAAAKAKVVGGGDFTGGVMPSEARMKAEIAAAEATKKSVENYGKSVTASKEYVVALKLETEQIGLNAVQKRLMGDAAEAAKAPTAALRMEIMKGAQVLAESTIAAEAAVVATKLLADSVTGLSDAGYKQVTSLQQQVDAQNQANAQIGMSQDQVLALVGAKELEEAANVRAAAQYAGPLHDAYIQYAGDLVKAAELQKELASGKQMAENAAASSAYWKQLGSTIESTGRFAFISFAANGMKAMDSIKASFKMMMAEIAYQLAKKWVLNMVMGSSGGGSFGGMMQSFASFFGGAGGAVGGATSGIGMLSAGLAGLKSGLTLFKSAVGDFLAGIGTKMGWAAGAEFGAGFAGRALGTAYIGGAGTAIAGTGMAAGAATAVEGASAAAMTGARIAEMMNPVTLAIMALDLTMRMFIDKKIPGTLGKILDFIPVIGPLLGAMFGLGPKRLTATNIQAQMSPGGEFGAQQNLTFIEKGGWFRGNRQTNEITELLASDFKKGLEVSFVSIREGMKAYVTALGLPADAISNVAASISVAVGEDQKKNNDAFAAAFKLVADQYADAATKSLNIDLGRVSGLLGSVASPTGEGLTKAQATSALASVQEVNGVIENLLSIFDDSKIMTFADQSNAVVEMMNTLGDAGNFLKQFQQEGESSSTTFTRLMTGFVQVDSALKLVGKSFETVGAESFKARQALLGLFGGADGLSKAISAFRDNFYTAGERLAFDGKLVLDYMSSIGESAIRTTDQFRALADSVMTSADPVKQKLFADLMAIQGAFAGLAKVTGEVSSASLAAAVSMANMADAIAAAEAAAGTNLDNAFSALQRAADAERVVIQKHINKITESISKLTNLSGALQSTLNGMILVGTDGFARQQGQAQIAGILASVKAGGKLPTAESMSGALSAVSQPSDKMFGSFLDYARDFAKTSSDIQALDRYTKAQISVEEKALAIAEKQLANLDAMVAGAQAQIDALHGIDSSVISVADAVSGLASAIAGYKAATMSNSVPFWDPSYINPATMGASGAIPMSFPTMINGSHAKGLSSVPFDGYIAQLHKGESVLPANLTTVLAGRMSVYEERDAAFMEALGIWKASDPEGKFNASAWYGGRAGRISPLALDDPLAASRTAARISKSSGYERRSDEMSELRREINALLTAIALSSSKTERHLKRAIGEGTGALGVRVLA